MPYADLMPMLVAVTLSDDGADAAQLEIATGRLARELNDVDDVQASRARAVPAPPGARGTGLEIAALVVTLADSRALAAAVTTVQRWLHWHSSRKISIKIDSDELIIEGVKSDEADELIRAWLSRHRVPPVDA